MSLEYMQTCTQFDVGSYDCHLSDTECVQQQHSVKLERPVSVFFSHPFFQWCMLYFIACSFRFSICDQR